MTKNGMLTKARITADMPYEITQDTIENFSFLLILLCFTKEIIIAGKHGQNANKVAGIETRKTK
jgi:hypothetical protein